MKLENVKQIEALMTTLDKCQGKVYLKDCETGDEFNLNSVFSRYLGIGQLLADRGEYLELFAESKDDERLLLSYFKEWQ